jgi:hypothetical protein
MLDAYKGPHTFHLSVNRRIDSSELQLVLTCCLT